MYTKQRKKIKETKKQNAKAATKYDRILASEQENKTRGNNTEINMRSRAVANHKT